MGGGPSPQKTQLDLRPLAGTQLSFAMGNGERPSAAGRVFPRCLMYAPGDAQAPSKGSQRSSCEAENRKGSLGLLVSNAPDRRCSALFVESGAARTQDIKNNAQRQGQMYAQASHSQGSKRHMEPGKKEAQAFSMRLC
jgi:hypothetical protein